MKKGIKIFAVTGTVIAGIAATLIVLISLSVSDLRREYRASENAIDAILNELQHSRIIAIGENHERVNEQLFIASNIQALYDAGIRYIFAEGGAASEDSLPSNDDYFFVMFYPWMEVGWRYESIALYQTVLDFNNALQSDDKIIMCGVENVPDNITDYAQRMNLRDSSAAKTIIDIMDAASDETKAIIWYGAAHTGIYPLKWNLSSANFPYKVDWLPLGYHLKKHYGNDYSSFYFVTDHDKDFLLSTKFILDELKLVLLKNMPLVNLLLPRNLFAFIGSWSISKRYNGFIVESETIAGTLYQYNPTNENLLFIFRIVEDYALECSPNTDYIPLKPENHLGINFLKEELGEDFDYASPGTTYTTFDPQGHFMLGLYYLKLYFGDKFDYSFWKTEQSKSLLSAMTELKYYAFANNTPAQFIQTNYSRDNMRLYHKYMDKSLLFLFDGQKNPARRIQEKPLSQARRIFPEDLWPLYWLGFVAAEKKQWEKGLGFFQELFAEELSYSMESLPLAYQKAALCAEKLGMRQFAEEYQRVAGALYNEFNIVVDKNKLSSVGYYN